LLERDFYSRFITANLIPAAAIAAITKIKDQEELHVAYLQKTITDLGGTPVVAASNTSNFFKASAMPATYADQLALAQQLEDTGVRAYKGRIGELVGIGDSPFVANTTGTVNLLTVALQIHSIEARHAAHIRTMRGQAPWPNAADDLFTAAPYTAGLTAGSTPSTTFAIGSSSYSIGIPVYPAATASIPGSPGTPIVSVAESNYVIGGVDINASLSDSSGAAISYSKEDAAAAFDEVLQPAEVLDASRAGGLFA
jgi:hypothetical protein